MKHIREQIAGLKQFRVDFGRGELMIHVESLAEEIRALDSDEDLKLQLEEELSMAFAAAWGMHVPGNMPGNVTPV